MRKSDIIEDTQFSPTKADGGGGLPDREGSMAAGSFRPCASGHRSSLIAFAENAKHQIEWISTILTGAHAAFFRALFPDSPRRFAGLVGAPEEDDSFPLTDGDILPAAKMFFAALTSLS
jgi:hypothetical protein